MQIDLFDTRYKIHLFCTRASVLHRVLTHSFLVLSMAPMASTIAAAHPTIMIPPAAMIDAAAIPMAVTMIPARHNPMQHAADDFLGRIRLPIVVTPLVNDFPGNGLVTRSYNRRRPNHR
jgi:hypothetical protein